MVGGARTYEKALFFAKINPKKWILVFRLEVFEKTKNQKALLNYETC